MAKINARGTRQIGPTIHTDRWMLDRKIVEPETEGASLYRQSWRLRSDGAVLERIIWVENDDRGYTSRATKHPNRSIHSSGYSIRGVFKGSPTQPLDAQRLRNYLEGHGYTIVKEVF